MGNCGSFGSKQVETAKVVVYDGRLQEFSYPVKVSFLLQLYPSCFICDSEEMGFDDVVKAVHEDEMLQPGQLYFALPLNRLEKPLPVEEMAALAVKASSALTKSGGGEKCASRRKQIVFFSGEGDDKPCRKVRPEAGGAGDTVVRRMRRRSSGDGREKFTALLSSIPE